MKDCPALHGKSWYNKAKETGLQNAGEARLASYSGDFETLIFLYFRNQGGAELRKRTKGSEDKWEDRGTRSGTRACKDT